MNDLDEQRIKRLIATIADHARATGPLTGRPTLDARVFAALRKVPRPLFVPEALRERAYDDCPLPIGGGQTISQPFIVALMSDLIRPRDDAVVLEVGTGSGYQSAVLAELVRQVYTLEIDEQLAHAARERLLHLGYANVEVRAGNGRLGWPAHAPYDAIVVTAAPGAVPPPLIDQLGPGGRMVIPVGDGTFGQYLRVIGKDAQGRIETRDVLPVVFVPLTGDLAY